MTKKLTTEAGQPWPNNNHSQTAGERGPILMQDYMLLEKLAQFNRERIPERVVHAKGAGAKGIFRATKDMSAYTKANLFTQVGQETPIRVRFSQVAGESGYPDTIRDVRGFAIKFYTNEGNYDIVGNNTPVFFINDPLKFPDFIHSQKRNPQSHLRDNEMQWDFWAHSPESTHQVTYLMGDRGNPESYRTMNGYGSHTFKWINDEGKASWVKYHFISEQGVHNMSAGTAAKAASEDPDYLLHDLFEAIDRGNYPQWSVCVQVIPYDEGLEYKSDIFDVTKVVSHKDYPLIKIGEFILNENPINYFDEVEELAFSPANFVPGIEASPDKLLQGRLFGYKDAARYRLGTNYESLPVNRPLGEVANYERDGFMSQGQDHSVNYEPNSQNGPLEDSESSVHGDKLSGYTGTFKAYDQDFYSQAGDLYRLMGKGEQDRLIQTIGEALETFNNDGIKRLAIKNFYLADKNYGQRIADFISLPIEGLD